MTKKDEPQIRLPAYFDNHPEVKAQIVESLKNVPEAEKQKYLDEFKKFVNGEMTWGEIRKISKRMQKEIARIGYLKFKMQDYVKAETMFKGLSIIDHLNWYYRAALGAIYQKQKRYEEAIEEYSIGLELKDEEISCLVNRGECFLMLKEVELAMGDFAVVMGMKLAQNNPWLIRAKLLNKRADMIKSETFK